MIQTLRRLVFMALAVAASGCATVVPLEEFKVPGDATYSSEKAYIVGSLSVPENQTRTIVGYNVGVMFRVVGAKPVLPLPSEDVGSYRVVLAPLPRSESPFEGDFRNPLGRVFVVEVTPGEYELYDFVFYMGNATSRFREVRPIRFSLAQGEIRYIGNVHTEVATGKNFLGMTLFYPVAFEFSNQSGRDLPLIKEKFPTLEHQDVRIGVLNGDSWRGESATSAPE